MISVEEIYLRIVLLLPKPIRVRLLARRIRKPNAEEMEWAKRRAAELDLP